MSISVLEHMQAATCDISQSFPPSDLDAVRWQHPRTVLSLGLLPVPQDATTGHLWPSFHPPNHLSCGGWWNTHCSLLLLGKTEETVRTAEYCNNRGL